LNRFRALFTVERMSITINGEPRLVPDGLTIRALLAHLDLTGPIAVERNAQVVPRAQHATVQVEPGDVFEIVHFVGGG